MTISALKQDVRN